MKTKPNNDWLDALESCTILDVPGPEWKTRTQLEKEFNLSRGPMERAVKLLVSNGRAEMKKFTVGKMGQRRVVPHYRLK